MKSHINRITIKVRRYKRSTAMALTLFLSFFPIASFAHAGFADRYIDILYNETTIAYVITGMAFICATIGRYALSESRVFHSVTELIYGITWIMVGIGVYNLCFFNIVTLIAPFCLYLIVERINTDKKTNPDRPIYRVLVNIIFTLVASIVFWIFQEVYAYTCTFLCDAIIPQFIHYRSVRDGIHDAIAFDINYISLIVLIHASWSIYKRVTKSKASIKSELVYFLSKLLKGLR